MSYPYHEMLAATSHETLSGSGELPLFVSWTKQAVSARLYDQLQATFPPLEQADPPTPPAPDRVATHVDYARLRVQPGALAALAPVWQEFWDYIFGAFLPDLLALWKHELSIWYPQLDRRTLTVEGQYAYRATPGQDLGLPPHCDSPTTLFILLWYFRCPADASRGGDLTFLRRGSYDDNEPLLTIPYQANHLVLFLNTPTAVHQVGYQHQRVYPRRHVRVLVTVPKGQDLFPCLPARDMVGPQVGVGPTLYGTPADGSKASKIQRRRIALAGETLALAVQERWKNKEW